MDDLERQPFYRLIIDVAGPGFRDRINVTCEKLVETEPEIIERARLEFERYGDPDNYVEVRRDYVVARDVTPFIQPSPRADDPEEMLRAPEPTRERIEGGPDAHR